MKTTQIQIGKTYTNRGKGRTSRTVTGIGAENLPNFAWNRDGKFPEGSLGVRYIQNGGQRNGREMTLWLDSFASWASREIDILPNAESIHPELKPTDHE